MSRLRTVTATSPRLDFAPTSAVKAARSHNRYIACPACNVDAASYLFHRGGVRFVRCTGCSAVYVNPAREQPLNYFPIDRDRPAVSQRDRDLILSDFDQLLERISADHVRLTGTSAHRTLMLGRYLPELATSGAASHIGLELVEIDDARFDRLAVHSDISWVKPQLDKKPQLVILHELLEACTDPGAVMATLVAALPASTMFVVTYTNADSVPARMMRRYWSSFFDYKAAFFSTGNLTALLARHGLVLKTQYALPVTRTAEYVGGRLGVGTPGPLRRLTMPVRAGNRVAVFGRAALETKKTEKLSIVLPVYNEARYAAQVIDAVLAKQLDIDRELIIVESNSTDGTREIVQGYEGRDGVRVVYEAKPQGKGHAVRTGLRHVTGTIILIQDADFEYDIDDYDALLEPILQRKAAFVLGSRSLGLDDWKVRKYEATPLRGLAINFAQVVFAKTYNALYQQRVTDVNTMFKVFRTECLDGMNLESDGFELDIELACKLARTGNSPMEIPVNYVARGYDEGKKIGLRDALPSYVAFFKYRFR